MAAELRVLGSIEVRVNDQSVDIGHLRQQCVLVGLLAEANNPVSVDQLVDRVWGDQHPHRARETLYTYLSRLRSALATADDADIVRQPGGYVLAIDPMIVDLNRFRLLVTQAGSLEDEERALALLDQAMELWRGEAFTALDTPWLNNLRTTLEGERREAQLDRTDFRLRCGYHAGLITELSVQAAERPLDERLAGQLMLTLYRSGRQAEALHTFQNTRRLLVDELGIEPGPELQQLHQQILAANPVLTVKSSARSIPVAPSQLPADIPHFTGRDRQLAELHTRFADTSERPATMITAIDGTAGVGKTALAVHFGHEVSTRFPDGQLYVDLRGYSSGPPMAAADAMGLLLRSLGLPPERIPIDEQEQAAVYRSLLAGKRMLIVLDNARTAGQVRPLLPGHPDCHVLITSRIILSSLDGATHLHLDVLGESEALTLLARQISQDRVSAELAAATTLGTLCARLPLALRIAGARLAARPRWPIATLVERLTDEQHRLDELQVADRAVRASFAVSYQALQASGDPVDQWAARAFRLLGLLDWVEMSPPVASALFDLPQFKAYAALERLVDDHLLDSAAPGRYHTHDLLRLYAKELARRHKAEPALSRVLGCYTATAEQAYLLLDPATTRIPIDATRDRRAGSALSTLSDVGTWVEAEHANLLAIARQAAVTSGAAPGFLGRLTAALLAPFDIRGYWQELISLRQLAAETTHSRGDFAGEALANQDLGWIHSRIGRTDQATTYTQQALTVHREVGDSHGEQICFNQFGVAYRQQERFHEAISCLKQGHAICQKNGYRRGEARILNNLGLVYQRLRRFDEAIDSHHRALLLQRELGDRSGEANALAGLGWAHHRAGNADRAIAYHQQGLALFREIGHRYFEAESLWGLGQTHHTLGHHNQARNCWQQSITILQNISALTDDEAGALLQNEQIPDTPAIILSNI
ncbi:AfsR/SARP family transcriptional regulator [Actinocrispum wychmicini]|uniref:DNA-binding SARP family transcriptional activator n=1 Tax=Actinocrispum wychmicini TaxID=1213861 RepID=A0A4R2JAK8_9PSEU|nr:AfsR/SARP family transcriptional regulator [Actinocrispum wychmicini]TCO55814.1 DNA-binding SARP family transcriptional activator [Actinocrispum wychmicini]